MTPLDFGILDALAARIAQLWLRAWRLRPELPSEDWLRLVVGILVERILEAEEHGRHYAEGAQFVDGQAITPTDDVPRPRGPADDVALEAIQRERGSVPTSADQAELTRRIRKAVRTIVAREDAIIRRDSPDTEVEFETFAATVERMAEAETIAAVQRGYQEGLERANFEGGYRRGINPNCCEICFWTWKEGYVYPLSKPMWQHPGCRCVPVPTRDPVGRNDKSPEEQALLDDLYQRFNTDRKGKKNG